MAREELIVGIGADTSDLQKEIQRAARDVESLSQQLAAIAAGADSGPVLQDLIQGIEEAGREMATTAEQTAAVNQLLAELRSGGQQAATGAEAMARGFQGAAQQQAALSAETRAWLATNAKVQAGFAEASRQAAALAAATAQVETSTQRMNRAFQESGRQAAILSKEIRNTVAGNEAWARGMANITARNQGFATSTTKATRGLNLLRGGLASTVASTLSLQSSLASVSQGLLFALGASGGTIVGVLAGLFAASKAYEAFTEDSRKAKEETEKLREALDRLRESFRDPGAIATEQFEAQRRVVAQLSQELADLTKQQAQGPLEQGQPDVVLARQIRRAQELRQLQAELAEETRRLAAAATLVGNISTDTDDARIDRATQLLALGIASREEQAKLAQDLAGLRAEEARLSGQDQKTQERRLKVRQQILAIEQLQQKAVELDTKPAQEAAKALRDEVQATANALEQAQAAAALLGAPVTLRLDVADALDDVRALQGSVDAMIERFRQLGLGTGELEGLRQQLRDVLAEADASGLEAVIRSVDGLSSRLGILQAGLGGVAGQQDAIRGTSAALVTQYAELIAAIERQGGALAANAELLKSAGAAVAALGPESAPFTAGLAQAITQLHDAEQALREFAALGTTLPDFQARLVMDVETAKAQVQAFLAESQRQLDQGRLEAKLNVEIIEDPTSLEFMLKALRASGAEGKKLARALEDPREEAEKLRDAMIDVADSVAGLRSVANSLGLIGEEGDRALQAIEGLAEASARFAAGDILGGVIGGLTTIASLGGPSEQEQERNRLQAENNERLQELTTVLNENIQGAAGLENIRELVEVLARLPELLSRVQRNDQNIFNAGRFEDEVEAFNQLLADAGISLEELNEVAKANGINLLDDEGRILAEAFAQLIPILNQAILELTTFGTSLADQRSILETRDALVGPDATGLGGLERDRELLLENLNLGEALEREIANLDLSSAGGQEAFRAFLQDLFDQGLTGFDPSVLKGEITAKDVLQIIGAAADGLNGLAEATEQATDQMLNVPDGFKGTLDAIRFAAEDAMVGMEAVPGMPLVPVMAGDGAQLPMLIEALKDAGGNVHNGDIVLNIDGRGKDTQQLAKDIVKELRTLSQAKFGTTDRWGEL